MTEFDKESLKVSGRGSRKIPRSFKELTPTKAFNPATFFYEMVWKAFLTKRSGEHKKPDFPVIQNDELALTWIGHASFLIQFRDMNAMVDPNFANWLFWQKRVRKTGLKLQDVPPLDLVMITHAHFDHFHKASLRKLPTRIAVVPWGVGDLVKGLGFERVVELEWWESFSHGDWKVTFTPSKHWGARVIHDDHRGFGGYVLEHSGRRIYHAGDSAYFNGFHEIGKRCQPEIALLPIGAYFPDSFRRVHMGPDEALQTFKDLKASWMVPMHYGSFKLSFEDMDEPPRWLGELAEEQGLTDQIKVMEEGVPHVF
ncbi:MAG: MBL fold metallo-hydrolase [Verrucomicrobia bacterium]|jgi:L-ascorbate metabolism protein UlaG (beta-lactamase superfamily)|nr:MBL fold metallo-hydrolase [Verrucomicrobiota bacterium]